MSLSVKKVMRKGFTPSDIAVQRDYEQRVNLTCSSIKMFFWHGNANGTTNTFQFRYLVIFGSKIWGLGADSCT